jgi:outer membrane receptor protein involved in Fe transport
LIDGMRVNDSVYDQATIGTEGLLDMDLVERIEYAPGPGAAVYGSNALLGVINVITKSGSAMRGAQAAVSLGSGREARSRMSYGFHAQDGTDVLVSGSLYGRRGGDLYVPEFDTPEQNHGVAQGQDQDRSRSFFVKASKGGFVVSGAYVNRIKNVPTGAFGAVFNTPNTTRDTQAFASAGYSGQVGAAAVEAKAYWGHAEYLGVGWYPSNDGMPRINVDGDHAAWYGATVSARFILPDQKVLFGADVQHNRRRDQFNFNEQPYELLLDDHRASSRAGIYVDDELQLREKLTFNAGLRYDRDAVVRGRLSPRAALIYRATPRDTVKLVYGTAFRSPNAYELYYEMTGEGGQVANPRLQAEEIATRELIWERQPDAYSKLTVSVFAYRMRELITQHLDPASGLLRFENTAKADANGVEVWGERLFADGLRVRSSYAWQLTKDDQGSALVNSPRHLLKLNAAVPLPRGWGRLGAESQCVSVRRTELASTAGYCTVNLTVSSARKANGLDWSVSLYNAANRAYADPAGPAFVQQAVPRLGRVAAAKVTYGF